jgi:hypothetical protein
MLLKTVLPHRKYDFVGRSSEESAYPFETCRGKPPMVALIQPEMPGLKIQNL